jgi:hypothetical protein
MYTALFKYAVNTFIADGDWHVKLGVKGSLSYVVRFQVLKAASMKMAVFWVVAPCSLV